MVWAYYEKRRFGSSKNRPKKKWLNTIEEDMRIAGVCMVNVGDRAEWRFKTKVANSKYMG